MINLGRNKCFSSYVDLCKCRKFCLAWTKWTQLMLSCLLTEGRCSKSMVADPAHPGTCYVISQHEDTWLNSRHQCQEMGGDLVTLSGSEHNKFVVENVLSKLRADGSVYCHLLSFLFCKAKLLDTWQTIVIHFMLSGSFHAFQCHSSGGCCHIRGNYWEWYSQNKAITKPNFFSVRLLSF